MKRISVEAMRCSGRKKPPHIYNIAFSFFSLARKPYVRISIFIYKTNSKSN